MALFLYRALKWLLAPVIFLIMLVRVWRGREDRALFHERLGQPDTPRPFGPLLWVHGASVGEVVSHLPVVQKIREAMPALNVLLTTGTATGRKMLERRAPQLPGTGAILIQYSPIDTSRAAEGFFKHWQPTASVFVESDFWPELLARAPKPVLLNGRISNRSWPKYKKFKWFFRPLLKRFVAVLAQSEADATRLKALGTKHVQVGGNLKYDAQPLPVDDALIDKFQVALQGRPVLVAASTHAGEEERVAELHRQLVAVSPDLLTVIVPRHPHRGTQAANAALRATKAVKRRGLGELPTLGGPRHTEIYVADTLGELGLWYRLSTCAIMGGSLEKVGGHNPLEPLKLGLPTVCGPQMFNFMDMVPNLVEKGLLVQQKTDAGLLETLKLWLTDPAAHAAQVAKLRAEMPKFGGSSTLAAAAVMAQIGSEVAR
jgi:3-deoxy-D-manno-octulosonic-acid transferase